jgi:hypothetical protein
MSQGAVPGIITDGLAADSYRQAVVGRVSVATGNQILNGAVFRRNINAVVGRNDLYPQYSSGDQAVLPTSAASGFVAGVYNGAPIVNSTGATATYSVPLFRQGVAKVRVGSLNGGTAITVGSLVGFSAATGASTYDIPTIQTYTVGSALGYVIGYPIQTALQAAVTATGSQTVAVYNTAGITTSTAIAIDTGTSVAEFVTPSAVTQQVKANGSVTLGGTWATGTTLTVTVNGVSTTYVTGTNGDNSNATSATQLAKIINASSIVYGSGAVVAPSVVSGSVVYFTALNPGTASNSITLTASSSSAMTCVASGATLSGGTYGTITATFASTHTANATVVGQNNISGGNIISIPAATGGFSVDTVLVDIAIVGA